MTRAYPYHHCIKLATKSDIDQIHQWLLEEKATGIDDNFLCNWSLTLDVFEDQNIFIYQDQLTGKPIAYLWGNFGILSVRHEYRKKGIGRELVKFGLTNLELHSEFAAKFQIMPETSQDFWIKMGAEIFISNNSLNGFIPINSNLEPPTNSVDTSVIEIQLYTENSLYNSNIAPIKKITQTGINDGNFIWLPERIVFHAEYSIYKSDVVVRVLVDDAEVFFDKAKRDTAHNIGIEAGAGYYFVNYISLGITEHL